MSLTKPYTASDFETFPVEGKVREGLRIPLIQRVRVTDCDNGEKRVVAEVEWKRGSIRQIIRNHQIGLSGKRPSEGTARLIAELRSFRIEDVAFASCTEAIFDCAIENLREDWDVIFEVEPLLAECFREQAGIDAKHLQDSWEKIGRATGCFNSKEYSKCKKSGESEYWMKELVNGGIQELGKVEQKSHWTNEQIEQLVARFGQFKDPRRKQSRCYPTGAMLAIICLSRHAGSKSNREHHHWVRGLSDDRRRSLGLAKSDGSGGIIAPSHHALNDFIAACRIEVRQPGEMKSSKLWEPDYSEGNVSSPKVLRACRENLIRGEFNDWLAVVRGGNFTGELWSKSKVEAAKEKPIHKKAKSVSRPYWAFSKSNERKFRKQISASRKRKLGEFTDSELIDLACLGNSFKDRRSASIRHCPFNSIVAIIGLGRCYTRYDAKKLCLWCFRLSNDQLEQFGLMKLDPKTGRPLIPSVGQLDVVMRNLGEKNLSKLYEKVNGLIKKWNKDEYLKATGGLPIKLRSVPIPRIVIR